MISVYPKYISAKYWAATVCDDYSTFALPILRDETKWDQWASFVVGYEPFTVAGVPNPYKLGREQYKELAFNSWEEWAKKAYTLMLEQENNN